jgi:cytidylate kinase
LRKSWEDEEGLGKLGYNLVMEEKYFQIAIDGPVGVGSSTTAKLLAEKLGFIFIDTGAMYRAATYLAMTKLGLVDDEKEIVKCLKNSKIEVVQPEGENKDGRLITIILDGEDISWKIRTEEISRNVPTIAAMPEVRKVLVKIQQNIAKNHNVVMEGRDITHRVLPNADLKIYLTADETERAERKYKQLLMKSEVVTLDQVLADLKKRDETDMNRSTDPLKIVEGVWVLDTTKINIDEVVDMIIEKFESIKGVKD